MPIGPAPVCMDCKHFFTNQKGKSCVAFPGGIPDDIWIGGKSHNTVRDDQQNEIVFEAKEKKK